MNRVALITGASRGIGRGIALELAKLGHNLVINYAGNQTAAEQTARDCVAIAKAAGKTIRAEICQADISIQADRAKLVDFAKAEFRKLDILVNNAGVAPSVRADILEADEESFDRMMAINVKGAYFLTQRVAKWMIYLVGCARTEVSQDKRIGTRPPFGDYHPKIITVSSVSAYTASTNRGDYCMSKAALSMLTPLFASRLADFGINVYEIRPGIIATDMTESVKGKYDQMIADGMWPIKRWGTPEDVGQAVAAIASDALPFSTGEVINVDGGFHLRRL
jgi:NAD(P)-dependent dehydrogenase (short-subunit alcohol dehydrogenase family)